MMQYLKVMMQYLKLIMEVVVDAPSGVMHP